MNAFQRTKGLLLAVMAGAWCITAPAQESPPGASVASLLVVAQQVNPEYASMRFEVQAADERVGPAGALPDPLFRIELMDITRGGQQSPTLWPGDVGSTRYTLSQNLPWFGKRDLKRDIAALDAQAVAARLKQGWSELATQIKTTHALRYFHHSSRDLSREILALMIRLEKITQVRYANGLAAQQDVIRAQIEQTNMKVELAALANEGVQMDARLNALLARPAAAPLAEPQGWRPLPSPDKLDALTLQERLRVGNPQLFADESRIQAAGKVRDLAYKNRYPDFNFGLSFTQYPGDASVVAPMGTPQHSMAPVPSGANEWAVMVELNIPLQQASRRAQERESEAMLEAARARKESSANRLLAELSDQLSAIDAAGNVGLLAATSLLPQAELTFNAALAGYENGKVDFATLLDAQRQIRQAKQSQLKAQYETQVRLAEIEKLLGEDL